jgi:hypothetical protein
VRCCTNRRNDEKVFRSPCDWFDFCCTVFAGNPERFEMSAEVIKQDWPSLEAALESLREHMARIKKLEAQIQRVRDVHSVQTQEGCWDVNEYMCGLSNGLELAVSILEDRDAQYKDLTKQEHHEPVAWGFKNTAITGSNRWMMLREEVPADDQYGGAMWAPLYTHPQPATTCLGCGESSTEDGFLTTYCLKCCEMASGKQTMHHWYDTGYDRSIHNNPDAQAWAKFFIDTLAEQSWHIEDIDEALMIGWFANAMMAMHDHTKRKWVGLTKEEADQLADECDAKYPFHTAYSLAVEAKLKEKNT